MCIYYYIFSGGAGSSLLHWGPSPVLACALLMVVAPLVAENRLQARGFRGRSSWALDKGLRSCGSKASLLHSLWDLPGPGVELVSLALPGFLTIGLPGKPSNWLLRSPSGVTASA